MLFRENTDVELNWNIGKEHPKMKVQELRNLLGTADREHVEKAFAECYKQLPKNKKEETDQIITDILAGKDAKEKKKNEHVPFAELKVKIEQFLENAYAQNYFAPNRVIPKSQRPKWRFLVKNYIKELEKIPVGDENYSESVKLLSDLYHMICYACNYYLFSTEDAFRSIGWEQPELFRLLVKRTFADGYTREKISSLLWDSVSGGLSREAIYVMQEMVLMSELRTSDLKNMAIEEAQKLVEKKTRRGVISDYETQDAVNELCGVVLMLSVELAEEEDGIRYYFANCKKRDLEVTLYCALDRMAWMGDDEMWLWVYDYGVKRKIKPREQLQREYQELLEKRKDEKGKKAEDA